ncbi:MAG: hypothetical protein ACYC9O_03930 [Candidatus Latescibacterota bacterium]
MTVIPGFSRPINVKKLAHQSLRLLCLGFLFAVLFHAGLAVLYPYRTPPAPRKTYPEPPRVIRTDIIEVPARGFSSPFMVHRPQFTARPLYPGRIPRYGRSMPSLPSWPGKEAPAALPERRYAYRPDLPRPEPPKLNSDSLYRAPDRFDTGAEVKRVPGREFSLRDELLTPEDFSETEAARRRGIVFHDPNRPLHVRGIIPIPTFYTSSQPSESLSAGIEGLVEGLRQYTDIIPGVRIPVHLLKNSSFEYPFTWRRKPLANTSGAADLPFSTISLPGRSSARRRRPCGSS